MTSKFITSASPQLTFSIFQPFTAYHYRQSSECTIPMSVEDIQDRFRALRLSDVAGESEITSEPSNMAETQPRRFGSLLIDPKWADLEIRCHGRTYLAHRAIVCTASKVFDRQCDVSVNILYIRCIY